MNKSLLLAFTLFTACATQAAVIVALAVVGLIQRQITARVDAHSALPAIETAACELRIATDLDVHTLAAGISADHGAGAVLARRTAATPAAASASSSTSVPICSRCSPTTLLPMEANIRFT